MTWWHRLFRRRKNEEELEKELRFHLDLHTSDLIAQGHSPEEARRQARLALGGPEQVKEMCRDVRGTRWLRDLLQDLRYGARMLWKRPGFTLIAVLTLGLGIGANTAIFSVVNAVLLRALPFAAPDRLVALEARRMNDPARVGLLSYPDFVDFQKQSQAFERLAVYRARGFTMITEGGAVRLRGVIAGADLFPLLGVNALYGRTFIPAEDKPGGGRAVILSHSLWQNRFNADPLVVGRTAPVNGESYTVVGVAPPGFQFPIEAEPVDIWINFARDTENIGIGAISSQRGNRYLNAVGRLKPGVTAAQAEAQLAGIANQIERQYPNDNRGFSVGVTPMLERMTGKTSRSLWMIFAAVGLVLLIACVNVAGLLQARARGRRREIAVRAALGASRWRVIRQLLTESLLLALAGGGAGLLLAYFGVDALIALTPEDIPRLREAGLDGSALLFTLSIATLTGVVMGIAPAWQSSQFDLQTSLKEGGGPLTGGRARLRGALVVAQVAIAVVLLVCAGLLLQSFARLLRVNPGFDADQLLTMRVGLTDGVYTNPDQVAGFHERLMTELAAAPGVSAYSTVHPMPLLGSGIKVGFNIEDRPNPSGHPFPYETRLFLVGADYFRTLGITLHEGREYTARDGFNSTPVAIINEAFARRFFPDQNPLGRRINPAMSPDKGPLPMREIVGVVADTRSSNLSEAPEPEVYLHLPQCPATGTFTLLLRTRNDVVGAVREAAAKVDRNVPLYQIRTFESYLSTTLAQPRFNGLLLGVFAGVALLLTAIGLYGVMAFSVSQHTQEIGVRMALGAKRFDVLRLVLAQGMRLTLFGVALGLIAAFGLTRLMKSLLFGVSATDPLTFVEIGMLLTLVALLACWIPARRATKVDPLIALRSE
jgi:predicted permease